MERSSRVPAATAVALLIALAALGGCSKKITIIQYPTFYDQNIKTIAITPFRNQTGVKNAGNIVSDKLAALLAANRTYKVYNRNDHRVLSDERDLQLDLGKDPQKVEAMFRKLGDVQAILTGVVSTYAGTTRNETRQIPQYAFNSNTGQMYISHYLPLKVTRYEVNVAASAALLRRDGTTIYATPVPVHARYWAQGSPPKKDLFALAEQASSMVALQLLEHFAILRKTIKVNPEKVLRTASELFENKWTYTDRFDADGDTMYVVVELPASCDRNRFEIRVVRKNRREYLAVQKIVWSSKHKSFGYLFSPKDIAAKGGGPGAYTIKFFSGPEPVFTRDFYIY